MLVSAAPLQALVSSSGKVTLRNTRGQVATVQPGLFEAGWKGGAFALAGGAAEEGILRGVITAPSGARVDTHCRAEAMENALRLHYTLVPQTAITVESLHIGMELPVDQFAGRTYRANGQEGTFPKLQDQTRLLSIPMRSLSLSTADAGDLDIQFSQPPSVLLQDNRQWGPTFSVRISARRSPERTLTAGEKYEVDLVLTCSQGIAMDIDTPVTITAGNEWIPLDYDVEIEAGSVLDFSSLGLHDAPAGKHGRVIAGPNGTFAYEDSPDTPQRFYGVNFCFSANYLEKEQADRLADRLARMGYNTMRVHHYEGTLVRDGGASGGTSISEIPLTEPPTTTEVIDRLQTTELGDRYGQRLRGFLHPPADGTYVFRIASDDNSELWVGAGDDRRKIASVTGYTGSQQFDKYPSQQSDPIDLRAGQAYPIEVLHKEGAGGDHLAVAWQGPDNISGIVPGAQLSSPDGKRGGILREIWKANPPAPSFDSTKPIPEQLDQLDYFLAALKKRGIYITTDLFVSRPIYATEVYEGTEGDFEMDSFKMAVPVNKRAFENWKAFSRNLLTHRNPYTGLTYANDPALAWISMINEGNVGNFLGRIKGKLRDDWQREWNAWLAGKYGTKDALQAAWGKDPQGDPVAGSVPLATNVHDGSQAGIDLATFCAFIEARMFKSMKAFLRDELGCKALFTNMNGWTNRGATHGAREEFDYIDDHFYVDHPRFLVNPWQLPSSCGNESPIRARGPGGRGNCFVRQFDKPFTISEYNYSGPGRFRGVGGILTGCLGALQGWDVIWRFAYSHNRGNLFSPSRATYFDIASDPLNQIADRAAICLYLRGDLREAPHSVALTFAPQDLWDGRIPNAGAAPGWQELTWVTKVGAILAATPEDVRGDIVLPLGPTASKVAGSRALQASAYDAKTGQQIIETMQAKGWLPAGDAGKWRDVLRSETGEMTIDSQRDILTLNTPMTAGGYAPEGQSVETGAVSIHMDKTYATVWVSSVDGKPIAQSKRMILCHLTDLQNSGARFGEEARKTLLAWGELPHLVQAGSATVRIRMSSAATASVYALSTSGTRLHRVKTEVEKGELVIRPSVLGPDGKARLVYEIVAN